MWIDLTLSIISLGTGAMSTSPVSNLVFKTVFYIILTYLLNFFPLSYSGRWPIASTRRLHTSSSCATSEAFLHSRTNLSAQRIYLYCTFFKFLHELKLILSLTYSRVWTQRFATTKKSNKKEWAYRKIRNNVIYENILLEFYSVYLLWLMSITFLFTLYELFSQSMIIKLI